MSNLYKNQRIYKGCVWWGIRIFSLMLCGKWLKSKLSTCRFFTPFDILKQTNEKQKSRNTHLTYFLLSLLLLLECVISISEFCDKVCRFFIRTNQFFFLLSHSHTHILYEWKSISTLEIYTYICVLSIVPCGKERKNRTTYSKRKRCFLLLRRNIRTFGNDKRKWFKAKTIDTELNISTKVIILLKFACTKKWTEKKMWFKNCKFLNDCLKWRFLLTQKKINYFIPVLRLMVLFAICSISVSQVPTSELLTKSISKFSWELYQVKEKDFCFCVKFKFECFFNVKCAHVDSFCSVFRLWRDLNCFCVVAEI